MPRSSSRAPGSLSVGLEQRRKIRETEELAQEVEELKAALGLSEAKAGPKGP
jgi:hypothetical protein